jgi:glycosyltransferase involved in cell wall biosynthesis
VRIFHYHLDFRLEAGGVARAVIDLCTALSAAGHDVTVLTSDARDVPDDWMNHTPGSPQLIEVDKPVLPGRIFTPAAIRAITNHLHGADVLHLHGMWGPYNEQVAAAARRLNLPYLCTVHGMLDDWCMAQGALKKRVYLAAFGRKTLHGATAVHCTAQAELDQARKWFPQGRGIVIPLIFDASAFEDLPGLGPAQARFPRLDTELPVVLFLSRLHYKKGVEQLIHAVDRLRRGGRECLVLIAGSGETTYVPKLEALVSQLGLEDRILLVGFVSGPEKVSLYQAADLFVLPTSQENFGFALFESLAAATPVVTTRGVDTWPDLEASGGAVIVDREPQAIASAVASLLDDPAHRAEMGRAGRAWVLDALSGASIVRSFAQLYAEAAAVDTSSGNG